MVIKNKDKFAECYQRLRNYYTQRILIARKLVNFNKEYIDNLNKLGLPVEIIYDEDKIVLTKKKGATRLTMYFMFCAIRYMSKTYKAKRNFIKDYSKVTDNYWKSFYDLHKKHIRANDRACFSPFSKFKPKETLMKATKNNLFEIWR